MRKYKRWTKEEDDAVISASAKGMDIPALAQQLERTISAIENRAVHLNVSTATQRKRHKGNNPVKQSHIDEAVRLYKEHGTSQAASDASGIPYGRFCYLIKLAVLYKMMTPPCRSMTNVQKNVLRWVKENPNCRRSQCISSLRKLGYGYYKIENAHQFLKSRGLIVAEGILWSAKQ